jgi:antitoxin (DNA-binding transcriptional repressor) of toxin-antitoxin stability system
VAPSGSAQLDRVATSGYSASVTIQVPIKEAKDRLSELIRSVERGERVVITRRGEVVAELRIPEPRKGGFDFEGLERWRRENGGKKIVTYIAPDFDDPLPEDFLITPGPY